MTATDGVKELLKDGVEFQNTVRVFSDWALDVLKVHIFHDEGTWFYTSNGLKIRSEIFVTFHELMDNLLVRSNDPPQSTP